MPNPNKSKSTSPFNLSGDTTIDSLLNENHVKWDGALGTGANLTFSFPWINDKPAYFASYYSNEPSADERFGFNTAQIDAARNALEAWANVANLRFREVSDTSTNVGDFRFAFTSALPDDTWGWSTYPNNYSAKAADVWVNSTHGHNEEWSVGTRNYNSLIHEIGHGLGLKHPGNYNGNEEGVPPFLSSDLDFTNYSIMSYNDPDNSYYWDGRKNEPVWVIPETPMVYDIQAIQYLYGANTNYHTGNDIYTFDPSKPFYKTIWDAGGNDTIDISAFSLGSTINLNSGSYSTIAFAGWFNGTNNLGIAFDVAIENVIGGRGNDTLIVNNTSNSLNGGAGIDTVFYEDRNNFDIIKNSDVAYTVQNKTDTKDIDKIINIERIGFTDDTPGDVTYIALDINNTTQSAGAALALYHALFGFIPDPETLGRWIDQADQINNRSPFTKGNLYELAQSMLTEHSPNGISHSNLVNTLYTNVTGSIITPDELHYFTQLLDTWFYSQAGLLLFAADHPLNIDHYADLIGNGLQYELFGDFTSLI